ncbi:GNAT family N-acetyltransferase [Leucobacter ruminantium]|uniref:N-acetyltransferase n=1 Tax=Leucobacter ruminantium TaxID=1289170 RepID=A0A939RV93_9MICO|nr:GNAT family N-acetyltransferase [Leucobacter ruminantium]MBO1803722.1 N-acetyltransferase [Leucobacter ruminantium]
MARYRDEDQAAADGIRIVHEPERSRYAALRGSGDDALLIGEAHYTLLGDDAIDFDHTVVTPPMRGTGVAGLLAQRALTGEAARGRRVRASCWFIAGYLGRHPELLDDEGRPTR